jgi:hypothetical protein
MQENSLPVVAGKFPRWVQIAAKPLFLYLDWRDKRATRRELEITCRNKRQEQRQRRGALLFSGL